MIKKTGVLLERPDLLSMVAGTHTRSNIDVYFDISMAHSLSCRWFNF
jgi:hypothetical protein